MNHLSSTLVLCDLDHLLLGADGNLTQVVRDVLQLFVRRGGRFTVFSQRTPRAVRSILGSVRLSAPALVCGGAMAYHFADGTRQPLCPEEIGSVEDFRFVLSPVLAALPDAGGAKGDMFSTGGTNADVYPILIFGEDAYGTVALKGKDAAEILVRNPGKPEKGNELGQTGSVGWKGWHVAARLNEAWMVRLEVAATLL